MPTQLINGDIVADPRLGRIPQHDARNLNYPIFRTAPPVPPRSMTWLCTTYLDQGESSACVGFAMTHDALARPEIVIPTSEAIALEVYRRAQELDEWPGNDYEGTSILAGLKAAKEKGWITEYRWAFSVDDLALAIGYHGNAILGINWYQSMMTPAPDGMLSVSGNVAGGHALLCNGVSMRKQKFRCHNSWGREWGYRGDCFISFADMTRLLSEQGEAAIPVPAARGAKLRGSK